MNKWDDTVYYIILSCKEIVVLKNQKPQEKSFNSCIS